MSTNNRPEVLVDKTVTHFLFPPSTVQQETPHSSRTPSLAVCYHDEISLPAETAETAMRAKPTYRRQVSLGTSPSAMHITQCLLDTGARLNLANMTLIPQPGQYRTNQESFSKLRTVSKQKPPVESKIIIHTGSGSRCVRLWIDVIPDLAIHMSLNTSFTDQCIRGVFPFKRKVIPRHSHPVGTLSIHQQQQRPVTSQEAMPVDKSTLIDRAWKSAIPNRIA